MKINSNKYVVLVTPEIKETVYQASVEIAGLMDDYDEGAIEMSTLELLQSHITKLENFIDPYIPEEEKNAKN
tara:strand:+ start:286 stop:501 length:216 start_codon:yes stop_codon:yes gene_type:complete